MATKSTATPDRPSFLRSLAKKYSVSEAAVANLYEALQRGGGGMAQFNHPDLGGHGQWMKSGMIMVGDMFNDSVKTKVTALCEELLPHLAEAEKSAHASGAADLPVTPSTREARARRGKAAAWWPSDYTSAPAATGGQNDFRYAYFPAEEALVVERGGQTSVYDTTGHDLQGFGQQQISSSGFSLRSARGMIDLDKLPLKRKGRSRK